MEEDGAGILTTEQEQKEAQSKLNTHYSRLLTICLDNQELTASHLFLAFGMALEEFTAWRCLNKTKPSAPRPWETT